MFMLSVYSVCTSYHAILKNRMHWPTCSGCCTLDLRELCKVLEAAPAFGVCTGEETFWSMEWAGVHLGGRRLPQACMSTGSGPPAKPHLKFGGRKFSQGPRGGFLRLLQARKLLQGVGLGSKKGVSYPLCQDTDKGEVTVFICFESVGHLSFLSRIVTVFNFIIFLF